MGLGLSARNRSSRSSSVGRGINAVGSGLFVGFVDEEEKFLAHMKNLFYFPWKQQMLLKAGLRTGEREEDTHVDGLVCGARVHGRVPMDEVLTRNSTHVMLWLTTSQWSVSYQTQVRNTCSVDGERNTLVQCSHSHPPSPLPCHYPHPAKNTWVKSSQHRLLHACNARFCARFCTFCPWFSGHLWFYVENTLSGEMWSFPGGRAAVIKVSVLDVLLKWIFHVFNRSPRHFSAVVV